MADDSSVELTASEGCLVARVSGELDYVSRPVLMDRLRLLIARGSRFIVLDLSNVASCDSAGLNVLLLARLQADKRGARLVVACVPPQLRRMLEMTGADQVLSAYDTVAEAEAALCRIDRPEIRG
ncbi:STAS domain-containing protein [Streptomyces griseorubiginosus]|uniref:STAS domain-containing protein n=1 Tax=Streptomyces griseorubiginosus TaxID=67304 RepID=UPI00076BF7AE|nr:STAS domain-containing protein [Streptomyces griseorubiginosus]KUM68128.1 hypothetical protein AQI84_38995 [Streptomyces griseorubiginosus]